MGSMSMEVQHLLRYGDVHEREGALRFGLHTRFPRYAEFWARYVLPNRRENDPSKLREGFPVELEDLCNSHYGVWYHLTIAYRQIEALDYPHVDIADPLLHLGTAIDLVERTLFLALKLRSGLEGKLLAARLTKEEFDQRAAEFWQKRYEKEYEVFVENNKPVNLRLHDGQRVLSENLHEHGYQAFLKESNVVRRYRNLLTHNLPPLRILAGAISQIPRPEHLPHYEKARWSSMLIKHNPDHYAPAQEVIRELADELVTSINDIWVALLFTMSVIAQTPEYRDHLRSFHDRWLSPDWRAAGTATAIHPSAYKPPSTPSAYRVDTTGDENSGST